MAVKDEKDAVRVYKNFLVSDTIVDCKRYGSGHINDTFLLVCNEKGGLKKYILQSISTAAFKNPEQVMSNIVKVTEFLKAKPTVKGEILSLVYTSDGKSYFEEDGNYWRIYNYVDNSICLDRPENKEDFYQCAVAFGEFQRNLSDFPAEELFETIPNFHNTPDRFEKFLAAVKEDKCSRAGNVKKEIDFIVSRKDFYGVLFNAQKEGKLPLRVTHNDTKSNNVMLDKDTHKPLCVIDLDTIMPGFSVNDFGDSIRFGASTAAEDEKDLSKVSMDIDMFETYAKGFLDGCGGSLLKDEIMLMPEGAKMMTIECGMRFLTDYLEGDVYFHTDYPEHNLVRCRTQLKLVEDMESKWAKMKEIVTKYALEVK